MKPPTDLMATIGGRPSCGDSLTRGSIAQKPIWRKAGGFLVKRLLPAQRTSDESKGIQTMLGILSAFRAYLRAVFADGIHKLYTIFDALAIAFYFLPGLDEWSRLNEGLRRSIGWAIILISFILANFSLYRKLALEETSLDESSLLVYPHEDSQCNAVRMLYAGSEIIRDLDIRMIYRDGDGKKQTKIVKEFFPKSDPYMAFEPYHYYHLEPNQVAYFPLLRKASVPNGKVTVSASFTGAKSGKLVQFERDFELQY